MKRFTHDIIYSEKIRRKEASLQRSRLHIIDVLFANNFGMDELHDQIDTFIITVSIGKIAKLTAQMRDERNIFLVCPKNLQDLSSSNKRPAI